MINGIICVLPAFLTSLAVGLVVKEDSRGA